MLKIGDFAKLSRMSVKTLRYYDEMGLLKPAQVDRFTGYRYYSFDQLPRLNRNRCGMNWTVRLTIKVFSPGHVSHFIILQNRSGRLMFIGR